VVQGFVEDGGIRRGLAGHLDELAGGSGLRQPQESSTALLRQVTTPGENQWCDRAIVSWMQPRGWMRRWMSGILDRGGGRDRADDLLDLSDGNHARAQQDWLWTGER